MSYIPKLNTVGQISKLLNVPVARIEYVLASRPHIQPTATAGGARCFADEAIAQIRHELNGMDARRGRLGGR